MRSNYHSRPVHEFNPALKTAGRDSASGALAEIEGYIMERNCQNIQNLRNVGFIESFSASQPASQSVSR